MTDLERDIIGRLVGFMTARGWALTGRDRRFDPPLVLTTADDVCRTVAVTGHAWIPFKKGAVTGRVLLIEGNGEDIISDCTAHTDAELDAFDTDVAAFEAARA